MNDLNTNVLEHIKNDEEEMDVPMLHFLALGKKTTGAPQHRAVFFVFANYYDESADCSPVPLFGSDFLLRVWSFLLWCEKFCELSGFVTRARNPIRAEQITLSVSYCTKYYENQREKVIVHFIKIKGRQNYYVQFFILQHTGPNNLHVTCLTICQCVAYT
jgi:hypothetical protein